MWQKICWVRIIITARITRRVQIIIIKKKEENPSPIVHLSHKLLSNNNIKLKQMTIFTVVDNTFGSNPKSNFKRKYRKVYLFQTIFHKLLVCVLINIRDTKQEHHFLLYVGLNITNIISFLWFRMSGGHAEKCIVSQTASCSSVDSIVVQCLLLFID